MDAGGSTGPAGTEPAAMDPALGAGRAPNRAAQGAADDVDDLFDVAIGLAVRGGGADAAGHVVLEDKNGERIDCRAQRAGLLEDVDAVFLALDHPRDPAHLALDSGEAANQLGLVAGVAVTEVVGRIGPR